MEAATEVNQVIDAGWSGVALHIRQLSQTMLYLVDDIRTNRSGPMDLFEYGKLGVFTLENRYHLVDALAGSVDYEPIGHGVAGLKPQGEFSYAQNKFVPLDDADFKLVCTTISSKWNLIFEAIEALVKPGMPEPSLDDIGSIFVESARHIGIAKLVQIAAETDLTGKGTRKIHSDLFGLGEEVAAFSRGFLPAHATGAEGTISVPRDPDLDTVIAAHLAPRLFTEVNGKVFIPRDSTFDPRSTNIKKEITVGCGIPFHAPDRLCFDRRCADTDTTNTELIVSALSDSGVDLSYLSELVQWADRTGEADFFPARLFTKFYSLAGTLSLAVNAWRLYLGTRFPAPYEEPKPEQILRMTEVLKELEEQYPVVEQASPVSQP